MILPIYNFDVCFPFDNVFFPYVHLGGTKTRLERQRLSYNLTTVLNFLFHYVGAKMSGAKLSIFLSWCQIVQCQIVQCQIVRSQIVLPPCIALSSKHSGLPKTRNGPCERGRRVFQTIRASPHTLLRRNGQCPYMEKTNIKGASLTAWYLLHL